MKAITVQPGVAGSARLEEFPEPDLHDGAVLVEAIAVGVCGTDVEIVEGKYGWSPPGSDRLVLGHESLGLLGVLLEPTTVVTKAWEQVTAVGQRAYWEPRNVLVTGASPIGLLAALIGKQRGLDVHVLDRVETGLKPQLVRQLGATYHSGAVTEIGFEPDVIVECTGVGQVIVDSLKAASAGGIVCLTGVGSGGRTTGLPAADLASAMVLRNNVIVGSVNANKRHWYKAGEVLARADASWLSQLVTRRERPESFRKALDRQPDDIKVVVEFREA